MADTQPQPLTTRIRKIFTNDWVIGLFLLAVYLSGNGYTYGWDDQHLEIPVLKSLIDPTLYAGDYYVEALKKNFSSFLYPALARFISVGQIPAAYFILYLISRFFFVFWLYKLWALISKKKSTGVLCVLALLLLGRVEEFLYRTFSHQEFALAIIMAGIYFFYKGRYLLASLILGLAANFHALYSLFPFLYLQLYLLWQYKRRGLIKVVKTCGVFLLSAAPFIAWYANRHFIGAETLDPAVFQGWLALYHKACPQNFTFIDTPLSDLLRNPQTFFKATQYYWGLVAFYLLNQLFFPAFRTDKKSQSVMIAGTLMILFSFIFSDIFPNRFILDLNLVRNTQFILLILMGYTTILVVENCASKRWPVAAGLAMSFPLIRFLSMITPLSAVIMMLLLALDRVMSGSEKKEGRTRLFKIILLGGLLIVSVTIVTILFFNNHFSRDSLISLAAVLIGCLGLYTAHFLIRDPRRDRQARALLVIITMAIFTADFAYYHYRHLYIERHGTAFWQLQRNWVDMQNYVRKNVPKNALLLVPHDTLNGGFRILSERKIVASTRDCGIVGFDYPAAVEWQNRMHDIETFRVYVGGPVTDAVQSAIIKYRVNYIVFMRYMHPDNPQFLEKMYENDVFSLYRVRVNPVRDPLPP